MKPLDDAFDTMDVTYLRYQDDVIILHNTKRQLERCKQRLMKVLQERRLCLSSQKTRIGSINNAFHFLGINYFGTQSWDGTKDTQALNDTVIRPRSESNI